MAPHSGKHVFEAEIINELGLHARAAAQVAAVAARAKNNVWLISDGRKVDASSVIDILTLACVKGSRISFEADHQVDLPILEELTDLVKNGFGE
jgi:phosphotransferase system HPr (HPr) family protein